MLTVTRMNKQQQKLVSWLDYYSTLKKEAKYSSETAVDFLADNTVLFPRTDSSSPPLPLHKLQRDDGLSLRNI
jgi:hypothetical protein